jgi:hypothetical protein
LYFYKKTNVDASEFLNDNILGVFRRDGPGYPLEVLALPSSGCGLFASIPHANRKMIKFTFKRKESFICLNSLQL